VSCDPLMDLVLGPPDPALVAYARRLRCNPPEVNPDGSATEAEMTRMHKGPEPGAYRLRRIPDDDPWYYHA
jgi:hypothetical protein